MGFTKSIKKAIEIISKGKYIAIQGSGDYSYPERIEKQIIFLEKHEDIALVSREIY